MKAQVDQKLHKILKQINEPEDYVRPVNVEKEKGKFFASSDYEPQFEYERHSTEWEKGVDDIDCKSCEGPECEYYWSVIRGIKAMAEFVRAVGDDRGFTDASVGIYGKPERSLISKALEELEHFKRQLNERYEEDVSEEEIVEAIEAKLQEYNLGRWQVDCTDEMTATFAVSKMDKKIKVKKGSVITKPRLEMMLIHEIETHVLRFENGAEQPYKTLSNGTGAYLDTEEGLASYNALRFSKQIDPRMAIRGSLRYLVIDQALKSGFRETFNFAKEWDIGLSDEECWTAALRAKRGLADASKPGGCTKDLVYFKGRMLVEEFVKGGGDLRDLYIGKVSLDILGVVQKLQGINKARCLPSFLTK